MVQIIVDDRVRLIKFLFARQALEIDVRVGINHSVVDLIHCFRLGFYSRWKLQWDEKRLREIGVTLSMA